MLNTSPMMFTKVTGVNFFAVFNSNFGISTFGVNKAAPWRRTTAIISCIMRNNNGRSGEELRTALFLFGYSLVNPLSIQIHQGNAHKDHL